MIASGANGNNNNKFCERFTAHLESPPRAGFFSSPGGDLPRRRTAPVISVDFMAKFPVPVS
jgi:hypothetical protein